MPISFLGIHEILSDDTKMKDNYIDCSVEECTHARLASGEVVLVLHTTNDPRDKYIYGLGVFTIHWPRLSITPVKLAPKTEPRKWEFEARAFNCDTGQMIYVVRDVPIGINLRVTLEEIL